MPFISPEANPFHIFSENMKDGAGSFRDIVQIAENFDSLIQTLRERSQPTIAQDVYTLPLIIVDKSGWPEEIKKLLDPNSADFIEIAYIQDENEPQALSVSATDFFGSLHISFDPFVFADTVEATWIPNQNYPEQCSESSFISRTTALDWITSIQKEVYPNLGKSDPCKSIAEKALSAIISREYSLHSNERTLQTTEEIALGKIVNMIATLTYETGTVGRTMQTTLIYSGEVTQTITENGETFPILSDEGDRIRLVEILIEETHLARSFGTPANTDQSDKTRQPTLPPIVD